MPETNEENIKPPSIQMTPLAEASDRLTRCYGWLATNGFKETADAIRPAMRELNHRANLEVQAHG